MDKLTRGRRPVRSQLTKTVKELEAMLAANVPDQKAYRVSIGLLDKIVLDLDSWDTKIQEQLVNDGAAEDVEDKEFAECENYRRLYLKVKNDIDDFANISFAGGDKSGHGSVSGDVRKRKYHLPEVKLKSFGGDLKDWLGWWSQFEKIHLDEELHDTDKFQYLAQAMEPGSTAKQIVDSYPQTEKNYVKAVEALRENFGRPDLLLQVYVRELLALVIGNVTSQEKLPLSQLSVRLESHLRCLAELNLDKADPATWLFPLVESSLTKETLIAFQRSPQSKIDGSTMTPPKTRLDLLMEFIKSEVQGEQKVMLADRGFRAPVTVTNDVRTIPGKPRSSVKKTSEGFATAAGLINQQARECVFCGKNHENESCFLFQKMDMAEKMRLVREKRLCFKCLKPGHFQNNCRGSGKCAICSGNHYTVSCNVDRGSQRVNSDVPIAKKRRFSQHRKPAPDSANMVPRFHQSSNQCVGAVLMNTLKVLVEAKDGHLIPVRLVGDSGSQRSYISTTILDRAKSAWIEDEWLQNVLFGGQLTAPNRHCRHEVTLRGLHGGQLKLELLDKDQITGEICQVPNGPWVEDLRERGVELSDLGDKSTVADILIGNDYWGAIRTGRMLKLSNGLVAEETVFGWTLGGRVPLSNTNMVSLSMTVGTQEIEKLWSLEAIGIRDPVEKKSAASEELEAMTHFSRSVRRWRDRYLVSLPWRENPADLPSNRAVAELRLKTATSRLQKTDKLRCYHEVFNLWEAEGLIVKIDGRGRSGDPFEPRPVFMKSVGRGRECEHFVPHRPVFKDSTTTPVRPVFDASCKVGRNPSLNDYLYKGPNLIELIPVMLLRFGENLIGVCADIRKAFQMIEVQEDDQRFQRFLWWADLTCQRIVVYQHTRVVFGFTCSPFLLGAVIQHHLSFVEDEDLKEKLCRAFYVDNLVSSVDSLKEFQYFREASIKIMTEAGMELRQWACSMRSNPRVDAGMKMDSLSTAMEDEEKIMPLLGILWNRETDTLSCLIKDFKFDQVTKRNILSTVAQIFDPTGILCPVLLLPKMLVQESWSSKLGWDERVPEDAEERFLKWNEDLWLLKKVQVPRFSQVLNATSREVHVFSDSSQDAMATVAFLRTELNGEVAVQFLLTKSRLTPLKKPTIPRAELVSCVLGVRVAKCVQEAMNFSTEDFTFWSDSSTALAWIHREGNWGVFVNNRVNEILRTTSVSQWRHVPGKINPADLPSRGCSPSALVKSKWWEGPLWLRSSKARFPQSDPIVNEQEVGGEIKKSAVLVASVSGSVPPFSSYRKNVAAWGWAIRFIDACRKKKVSNEQFLNIEEMRRAEKVILKNIQAETFPGTCSDVGGIQVFRDTDGIIRARTRLSNRCDSSDFIYPILLPKSHPLVEMLIRDVHLQYCHGGIQFLLSKLREKYWIVQSRRIVRKVVRSCVQCRRHSVSSLDVHPASLPSGRVEAASAFTTTGVDLAGPLYLKDGKKAWIVLYTCALYRAVHLDLVDSLATDTFLRSLERFVSMYGRPNTMYSDNGTNFVGAVNLFKRVNWDAVRERCGVQQIQWIFNPPTAAWWGGWWERMVRSVKDLLKRMLGRTKLTEDELRTCLAGVTATINDRPLTLVNEDTEDLIPLTPSMFIRPLPVGHLPDLTEADFMQKSYRRMKDVQSRLQHRFRKEYLSLLVARIGKKQQSKIDVGDVVLVGQDNRKRYEWPLGRVEELLPGRDGRVRVVKVKTATGVLTRPLQRLFPLEVPREKTIPVVKTPKPLSMSQPLSTPSSVSAERESEKSTRSGRVSRRPVRYGQWFSLVKTG